MADWQTEKYREVFEGSLQGLRRRREIDPTFGIEDAERQLAELYRLDGLDWLGRGALGDIVSQAEIAAFELFINEWKADLSHR